VPATASAAGVALRLLLAALSGVLAGLAMERLSWPQAYRSLLQGGLFGALVLVPFLGAVPGRFGRALALVVGGMAIQVASVRIATSLYGLPAVHARPWLAFAAAGLAGALLVAALVTAVAPGRAGWRLWALVPSAGLAGGLLLAWPLLTHQGIVWLHGFTAWQVLVCLALWLGSQPSRAP
jgi:hypothetical protein